MCIIYFWGVEIQVYDFSTEPYGLPAAADEVTRIVERLASGEGFTFHTSGSTGSPRPVHLSNKQIRLSAGLTLSHLHPVPPSALLCLPLDRVGGFMVVVRAVLGRMRLYRVSPSANPLWQWPADIPVPSLTSLTPMQLSTILQNPLSSALFRQFSTVFIGGAPLSETIREKLREDFPTPHVFETYAMTETASQVALQSVHDSCFTLLPGFQISTDENGGLVISHPELGITDLHTHDRVKIIAPHQFVWKGRLDFVLNSGGIKIHPEDVERALRQHLSEDIHFILSAASDPVLGDKLVLCVEGDFREDIIQFSRTALPALTSFHRPKGICFIPHFPLTPGGKIDRIALRNMSKHIFDWS